MAKTKDGKTTERKKAQFLFSCTQTTKPQLAITGTMSKSSPKENKKAHLALLLPRRVVELALGPEAAGPELDVVTAIRLPGPAREPHPRIRGRRRYRRLLHLVTGCHLVVVAGGDGNGSVVPPRGLEPGAATASDREAEAGELLHDRRRLGGRDRGGRGGIAAGGRRLGVGVRHWS
jgi:hypothetical protein